MPKRAYVLISLGVVMIVLGAIVALRPLYASGRPLTGSLWLDVAFALFFVLRGAMNVRTARRLSRRAAAEPPQGSVER